MHAGSIIREARRRAGLTQRELGERLATHQPAVARWESGRDDPAFSRVVAAVSACGLSFQVQLTPGDAVDRAQIAESLALPPAERVDRLIRMSRLVLDGRAAVTRRRGG